MDITFDTREKLVKPTPTVVRIVNKNNRTRWATGTIIHNKQVLTAAHVCYEIQNQVSHWEIIAGEHGGFGYPPRNIKRAAAMPLYLEARGDSITRDIGVITVTDAFESSLVTPLGEFKADTFLKQNYSWIGYPSDKIPSDKDVYQWGDYGKPYGLEYFEITFVEPPKETRTIVEGYFKNIATPGQSGSALIDEAGKIIGVLSGIPRQGPHEGDLGFGLIDNTNYKFIYEEITGNLE
ncbi:trypsin-like serine peptidase [Bacillus wiedmannii]|uniref:trypsin-like serine peptidase n=1 Tax=Bacillus wiedmannii TaxID=1890302 RepID=UPI000B44262D|nr:trypsin-like serine protease [Bacillus wiedmannii]OUB79385.1 hypothetical protein BK788_29930 [Bacillus thuringiensis serovar sinensis]